MLHLSLCYRNTSIDEYKKRKERREYIIPSQSGNINESVRFEIIRIDKCLW